MKNRYKVQKSDIPFLLLAISLMLSVSLSLCADQFLNTPMAIINANIFNVNKKIIEPHRTILIRDGIIMAILDSMPQLESEFQILDVEGKLVIPGLIDVHHHSMELFPGALSPGGAVEPDLSMHPDSLVRYRKIFARAYLPYGVTTVREVGNSEKHIPLMQSWMKSNPSYPDVYPCGGALVSYEENRNTYMGHVVVNDSLDAALKVQEYFDMGFRSIKLYWRLRPVEFDAAIKKALELNMNISAHIASNKITTIRHGLSMSLKNIEHAYTLGEEILSKTQIDSIYDYHYRNKFWFVKPKGAFFLSAMNFFNLIGEDNPQMIKLINDIKSHNASVTPTLHIFAQRLHLTYFTSKPLGDFDNSDHYSKRQINRAQQGYSILASYVKSMFDAGIQLNMGTDCSDPGKAALSELLLLNNLGIPMTDVLCIGTINGAKAIGQEINYGSIEPGKKANLIVFSQNPLDDPKNLLSLKIVIKDGKIWSE